MEEGLLVKQKKLGLTWCFVGDEVKRLCFIAGPMVVVISSQFLLQIISMMMAGHLADELSLAGTALALSLCTATGLSPIMGMASALETLCGQAYGAEQYQKLGTQTYTAIFSLIIICIPISILWIFMETILIFSGQDPSISREAGTFIIWFIPALFGYATLQPLMRYFQMQSMMFPMLISSFITVAFHIPVCWVLVHKSGMQNHGAALAMGISFWLNVVILSIFMFSPACEKTRAPLSMEVFDGMKEFFRFAIPSAVMVCLEWWSCEILVLSSGLLPDPQLETSVLSVCVNLQTTLYAVPFAIGSAVSTRVSNEMGSGNSEGARVSVIIASFLSVVSAITIDSALYSCRNVVGYIFSSDKEVVDYVSAIVPLVCISILMDGLQVTLLGIVRGCGLQHLGAYANLAAYYLFGIPIALFLGFVVKLRGTGLWMGIICGASLQSFLLAVITILTNWEKQAIKTSERLFEEKSSVS